MPITLDELNDFAGGVDWSEEDQGAAERLLAGVQAQLGNRLNTFIEAGPEREEWALVSAATPLRPGGLLCTAHRIHTLIELDGYAVLPVADPADGEQATQPPPVGTRWADRGRLRIGGWTNSGTATKRVVYLPGLRRTPDIDVAIMRKAHALLANRNDDTVVARGTDATPPALLNEQWTDAELGDLARLYNTAIL